MLYRIWSTSHRPRIVATASAVVGATRDTCCYTWLSRKSYSSQRSTVDTDPNRGPLKGVKIVDLTRVLAGPFCTQILADYGADVIKIEAVDKGDDTRHWMMQGETAAWNQTVGPMSNYFSAVNRNKRSLTLDLKKQEGKTILKELLKDADVLVENFKPGSMERLGLGYDSIKEDCPRLIYASISGYGRSGPYGTRGGYDPIAGAEAGLLHVTGERNGPPVRPGLGLIDLSTGLYLHGAIMAALYARSAHGQGQRVDGSLFETQMSMLINVGMTWLNLGIEAERWGCQHPSIAPYDAFKTKDLYLVCGATNDAQFGDLCRLLGLESLAQDERFATNPKRVENREALSKFFNKAFVAKTTSEWIGVFEGTGLPFAPINNMERAFRHPQTDARSMVAQVPMGAATGGHIKLIGPAVKFSHSQIEIRREPPTLGQHTDEILAELGLSHDETRRLREQNVV